MLAARCASLVNAMKVSVTVSVSPFVSYRIWLVRAHRPPPTAQRCVLTALACCMARSLFLSHLPRWPHQGQAVAVKQLDFDDGRLKVAETVKGLKEGERLSLCGQFAIHNNGKWRPMEKENCKRTMCAFPAMTVEDDAVNSRGGGGGGSGRGGHGQGNHHRGPTAPQPTSDASGTAPLSAASIQMNRVKTLNL